MNLMHSSMDELRNYRTSTRQLLAEGKDALSVMVAVDSRLIEVSNHVAICHRVLAESRANLPFSMFARRKKILASIERTGNILEELDQIQYELVDVKGQCVGMLRSELQGMQRAINQLLEKS